MWAAVLNVTGRYSATRYMVQNDPCRQPERMEEYVRELETKMPRLIVLQRSGTTFDRTVDFIRENGYREIYHRENSEMDVYVVVR